MSDQDRDLDRQFREIADTFIGLANSHLDKMNRENVGMALLYAASRFNAFVVASNARNLDHFRADREKALEFFGAEYQRMLGANLSDHEIVFEQDLPYGHLQRKNADPS
jgi:hypothetical protein